MRNIVLVGLSPNKGLVNAVLEAVSTDPDLLSISRARVSEHMPSQSAFTAWKLLLPGMSDAHGLRAIAERTKSLQIGCSRSSVPHFVYTGVPYYDIHYVDSIAVVWNSNWDSALSESQKTAEVGKLIQLPSGEPQLLRSDFGYGIVFCSDFLYRLTSLYPDPLHVEIDVPDKTAQSICEEVVRLCGDPTLTPFSKLTSSSPPGLRVVGVRWMPGDRSQPEFQQVGEFGDGTRQLPFKRFIAYPRLAPTAPLAIPPPLAGDKSFRVFALGGVEHNLGMLHLLAIHHWQGEGQKVLIAGNAFAQKTLGSQPKQVKRLGVWSEGFVATLDGRIRHRHSDPNKAVVYHLQFNRPGEPMLDVFAIQGYSGFMTRVALLKLLQGMKRRGDSEWVPGVNYALEYELPEPEGVDRDSYFALNDAVVYWDEHDCMNNPASAARILSQVKHCDYG